ncbi:MAG TPA: hypothetical protein EYQ60_04870 [Myxococcales bacterium]|nr:hypothetical protein [Myxococcales bacterium]
MVVYGYHREAECRDDFRGTSAHNTVEADGLNQSKTSDDFPWRKEAGEVFQASGKSK